VATQDLPRPTKGPYSLDLDDLFAQASKSVLARGDILAQLNTLPNLPDLPTIIATQREILAADIRDQVNRCIYRAVQLHEILVRQLASHPARLDQLRVAVDAALTATEATAIAEAESQQVAILTMALPGAREVPEFRTLVTEWESLRRDIIQTLESAMLSVALTALNTILTEQTAPRMRVTSFDGLRQTVTTERIVITDAYEQLEAMIRDRHEASFGIAGPRGVGKSTLINFFATTQGVRNRNTVEDDELFSEDEVYALSAGSRLGVVVSAPVAYDAREFVLHLYAELCKSVLGENGDATVRRQRELVPDPEFHGGILVRAASWSTVLGSSALAGGLDLFTLAILHRLPWTWRPVADAGAALLATAGFALILLLLLTNQLMLMFDRGIRLQFRYSLRWSAAAISAVGVVGLTLFVDGGGWSGGTWPLITGGVLLIIGSGTPRAARMAHQLMSTARTVGTQLSPDTRLHELAFDHLRHIWYQQSFSRERSVAMKLGGGLAVGVDAGGKRGETWEERPKGYPELVSDLRAFLAVVSKQHTVVIGVDELDKLRSAGDVETFLNDIKGIFGASGCFFLVSVSEDAAASFERRGVPFRDVFDSTFDDVIPVQRLDLAHARNVLYGLLLGWSQPFVELCYVLSGGLPRDLRRTARELITYRDSESKIELAAAALGMCRREGEARLRAVRHELMRDPFEPVNIELLTRVAGLAPEAATAEVMRNWHDELSTWASEHEQVAAGRLGLELAAYLLFAATVIEFFDPAVIATRTGKTERLEMMAAARQSLAVSPGMSLAYTRRFREVWGLDAG
jgi:hypothetical protein